MREIKFRGRRVDNGAWVYGYYSACIEPGDNGGVEHLYRVCRKFSVNFY